jgi:protein-tyrosine phosphatase
VSAHPSALPRELHNLHDLGGTPTPLGPIQPRRLFRSANPDALSPAGWTELQDEGIRTIVDLRNDYELADEVSRPDELLVLRCPIEDQSDDDFMAVWGDRLGSPEYYPEVLRLWPELVSAAIAAIADAQPGGVLVHCMAGRDRTGMITAMVLELLDVDRDSIASNYERGVRDIDAWWRIHGGPKGAMSDPQLETFIVTATEELNEFLDAIPMRAYLLAAGVTPQQLARLRARLLDASAARPLKTWQRAATSSR